VNKLLNRLRDRNFLLFTGAVLGLIFGDAASAARPLIMPALAIAMTVTLVGIGQVDFSRWRALAGTAIVGIALTYVLHAGLKLVLASTLGFEGDLWAGFVLDAAVPSGVAVVPLSFTLGGDTTLALVSTFALYASALVIMPIMVSALLGATGVNPLSLLPALAQLIVGPAIVARILASTGLRPLVEKWRGTVVNWAFALLFFTVIGLNRDALLSEPNTVVRALIVAAVCSLGIGAILESLLSRTDSGKGRRRTLVLLATIKNTSLAAATALSLFGERAALPAAVVSAVNVVYMMWLNVRWRD
jgi:BASS family bile acid:Na+ symporter